MILCVCMCARVRVKQRRGGISACVCVCVCLLIYAHTNRLQTKSCDYGVATISRLLKIIGLFCRMSSLIYGFLQKRPVILRSLLIVATSYCNPPECIHIHMCIYILQNRRRRVDISTWCSVFCSVLQCVCSVYAVCCSVCCNVCCSVSLRVTRRRSRGVFLHGVID